MIRGYKIRIYPTSSQKEMIWNHIGACRFIWNYMLDRQHEAHDAGLKHLSAFDMMNLITPLKHTDEYRWLYEVSNTSLQRTCSDLEENYQRFFKKVSGYPGYKTRRRSKAAYPVSSRYFYFIDGCVQIQKIGRIKYKSDFEFPQGTGHKFCNVRISFDGRKYFVSFGIECESQARTLNDYSVGIDLGIKELAVVAYGDQQIVFHNINKSKEVRDLVKRIKHSQRNLSRKYRMSLSLNGKYTVSKRMKKEIQEFRRLFKRLTDIRLNYIHQCTHQIIELLPRTITMEDLNICGMVKNKHLSNAILSQGMGIFIRQMQYKSELNGIEFVRADRFYPSSKTCSKCGAIKHRLKLSERVFRCDDCGNIIDRDYNAAINLMLYGANRKLASA